MGKQVEMKTQHNQSARVNRNRAVGPMTEEIHWENAIIGLVGGEIGYHKGHQWAGVIIGGFTGPIFDLMIMTLMLYHIIE